MEEEEVQRWLDFAQGFVIGRWEKILFPCFDT